MVLVVAWVRLATSRCCCARRTDASAHSTWTLLLLRPMNLLFRVLLLCCGVLWVEEKYPAGTSCVQYGYLRRQNSPRVIVATHTSFLEALYFGSRCIPVVVVCSSASRIAPTVPVIHPTSFTYLNSRLSYGAGGTYTGVVYSRLLFAYASYAYLHWLRYMFV